MKNLPVDSNSRTIQCAHIGFTKNFSTGVVDKEVTGYVRLKNIGEEDAIVRLQTSTDAMVWYFPQGNGILLFAEGQTA